MHKDPEALVDAVSLVAVWPVRKALVEMFDPKEGHTDLELSVGEDPGGAVET